MSMDRPAQAVPFEIADRVATNGHVFLSVRQPEARLFRRRGICGLTTKPPAEVVLPLLNQLCGDLLAQLDMPGFTVAQRLEAISQVAQPTPPRNAEWAVAELNGVRCYVEQAADGTVNVILTNEDLRP